MRKALAAADLLRITIGEEWGGMGLGDVEASIVLEEIARADVSSAICCQLTFNGPPRGIEHLGPPAMKERWLPAAADGEALISIGITEPDAGSAVQNMRAALVEDGPGRWRLNAYKNYSTLGDVAQGVLVWCRWPGGEGAKGIGAVIVPTDREGVSVTGRHKGMGIHAATEAELAFDGVEIGADDILLAGDPSSTEAFKVLLSHLNHERCGNAAMCIGAAQGALEHAVRYMSERVIGGKPLSDLQGLQWKLADMAVQLEGARLLAKTAANLAAKFVCDEAMQIHGGYGYSREYPLERAYRDIRGLCFGAGTVEAQRNFIGLRVSAGGRTGSPGWRNPLDD
jgi:alkylation response protein AidB-like acyl-CoA dehydrogenase